MRLPKKIYIGGVEYSVELVQNGEDEIHEVKYYGSVNYDRNVITIYKNRNNDCIIRTLLHEIVHIVDSDLKIGLCEDNVHRFSAGLYGVLKDNKMLKE